MRNLQVAARAASLSAFALPLMRRLREQGFHVEALCGFDGMEGRLTEAGFTVHRWDMEHTLNPLRLARARRELNAFLRGHSYDIIHTHCSFGGILANPVARDRCRALIYTQHGFVVHDGMNPLLARLCVAVEKIGLRAAHRVICISQAERDRAITLGVGGPDKFLTVPGAGVSVDRFVLSEDERERRRAALRADLGLAEDDRVLLTVSRLTWDKGYREMVEAVRRLKAEGLRLKFLAAGSGRHEAPIRGLVTRAGLDDDFLLLGWRDDVLDLYCACDAFVFASHREGLPIAPIEAMATGLPVVASALPGCREEIEDGASGLLYPVGDTDALAEALRRVLAGPALAHALGAEARVRARRFDLEVVLDLQVRLYEEVSSRP